ncbi:MAG: hypothetical protein L0Z62_49215 [Gemmataceae bacterium]|nr:hypothetical protein [Gemmataceae bacterium]
MSNSRGGLLHLVLRHPYQRLQDWVGLDAIADSFLDDMERSAPFFCLHDDSPKGRTYLITELGRRCGERRGFFNALLVQAVTADGLDFLGVLDGPAAVELFAELAGLTGRPGSTMSEGKTRRLAELLAPRLAGELHGFLHAWLALPEPQEFKLGVRVLAELGRTMEAEALIRAASWLEPATLHKLLVAVAWCPGFPYGNEVQLAHALAHHPDHKVRTWAQARVTSGQPAPQPLRVAGDDVVTLTDLAADVIAGCPDSALHREMVVRQCLKRPVIGLAPALARRPEASPNLRVCLALLACHDPVDQVAAQFARFASADAAFLEKLDRETVGNWLPEKQLGPLGHAWLFKWEEHNFAYHNQLTALWPDGLHAALAFTRSLAARVLARRTWEASGLMLSIWRWRNKEAFQNACTDELGNVLIDALDSDVGDVAARALVQFHEAGVEPERVARWKLAVVEKLPDLSDEVRRVLQFWVDVTGLGARTTRRAPTKRRPELVPLARTSSDLDQLAEWCCLEDPEVVGEALLRLLAFDEAGAARLAEVLHRLPPPPLAALLAENVELWPEGPALESMMEFVVDPVRPPELRFLAGLGLFRKGSKKLLGAVFDAACADSPELWFRPEHCKALLDAGVEKKQLALRLAVSLHPHAYTPAVKYLVERTRLTREVRAALLAFLETGTGRLRDLRLEAARWLHRHGDRAGFPLLLQNEFHSDHKPPRRLLAGIEPELVRATVSAALTASNSTAPEQQLLELLRADGVDVEARTEGYARLLAEGVNDAVKTSVLAALGPTSSRARKLRQVGEVFAWGVRQGRELTGRLFAIEMLAGEALGYTRLNENKVYVNALPVLRPDPNGRDVVQALIVHEFGHHMYHRGDQEEKVWKRAEKEGLHSLLNLVADEHLERNLRVRDGDLGDKLKRLAAHAFQHAEREVPVESLLDSLQGQAFAVLTATRLGVARRAGRVAVQSGKLLLEMEQAGMSFARFVRALRMGLGNRSGDPKVAEGLALFKGRFRQSSMEDLYGIAVKLREIFGHECQALLSMSQDGCMEADASELLKEGEGLSNAEIQEEVQRVLNPQKRKGPEREGKPGSPWINVSPEERFETITTVQPINYDGERHAVYARQVLRQARQMRRYLSELGLSLRPQRQRLRGKQLDRTRLQALVTQGDPRVLIARELRVVTDLFLGVVIDCSGSMQSGENIEKAKLFGVLLAEAARGLEGIDVRLFGFTDQVIYDAGNAARCSVHGLVAQGGNNDAAGLWHAAQAALASRRKAKLLVMISDGLPTECSVEALRALVRRLTQRMKMCCAQVAVRPLAEVCFPNYVLLEESDPDASVRRFGSVVARLVRKALRGG